MDLLAMTSNGQITFDEAYDLHHEAAVLANRGGPPWPDALGFSRDEVKAYLHGASLEQLTRVRAEGWPTDCCRCQQALNLFEDYWFFVARADGRPTVRHIVCPGNSEGRG